MGGADLGGHPCRPAPYTQGSGLPESAEDTGERLELSLRNDFVSAALARQIHPKGANMRNIIYIIGLVVVVIAVLSLIGLV